MDLKSSNNKGGSQSPLEFNKKAIITASVIVGVLLLVGVSYGVYYKMNNTVKQSINQVNGNTNQILPSTNTNSNTLVNDVSIWQTFSDTTLGFEVKYPKEWGLQRVNSQTGANDSSGKTVILWSNNNYADFIPLVGEKLKEGIYSFSIRYNDTTRSDYANDPEVKTLSSESITVAGVTGTKDKFQGPYGEWTTVYLKRGEIIYSLNLADKNKEQKELSDKILSNFKFTNTVVDTSDWKTYKNTKNGFEFKYPTSWVVSESDIKTNEKATSLEVNFTLNNSAVFHISVGATAKNLDTIENEWRHNQEVELVENTTFQNLPALRVLFKGGTQSPPGEAYYFIKENKLYALSFNPESFDTIGNAQAKAALDTFVFTSVAVDTSDWKTYQDAKNGFEIKYPKNFIYREEETSSYAIGAFFTGQEDSSPVKVSATLELPDSVYPNTNFHSAIVTLASAPAITTLSQCQNFMSNGKEKILQNKAVINNTTFYQGETGGAAAGTAFHNKINHAFHNGTCFEVGLTLVSSDIGLYPDTYKEVNKDEVWNTLENIFSTFTFIK